MTTFEEKGKTSRRQFFANALKAIAGLFALGLGIPLAGFAVSPVLKKGEHAWIPIADLAQMQDDVPLQVTYQYARKDGWMTVETVKTAFVVKKADGSPLVLSNICTHLGCGVNWDNNMKHFMCPCHGGTYDAEGNVLDGPPPKPLFQLAAKVEANKIFVKEA